MTVMSFQAEKKFFDDANFPYGFERSGEFSIREANLLVKHGQALLALANGYREPADEVEQHFVETCRGEKAAESEMEILWHKYVDKITNKPKLMSYAISSRIETEDDDYVDESDED